MNSSQEIVGTILKQPLRPGSSGTVLGWIYGKFQVQVPVGTRKKGGRGGARAGITHQKSNP